MGQDHEDEYPESHHQKPSPVTRAKHIHLFCVQVHMRVRDRKRERGRERDQICERLCIHVCVSLVPVCPVTLQRNNFTGEVI